MEILIISGLSGAGKSSAATYLEDMGYYTVDNVPADIILKFAEFCSQSDGRYDRVALVSDVRSGDGDFSGLLDVMDRDTDAFNVVSDAFAMPKATDEEKAARSAAIQEGLKGCTKTPMEMMELIDETLTLAQSLLGRFNDTSASDLGVAFLSLKAGIQGAWLNVLINVGSLKDQEFAAEYRAKGEKLLAHALPLADECYAEIVKLIEG